MKNKLFSITMAYGSFIHTTALLIIIIIIAIVAFKLALKNKNSKCANCKLNCPRKTSPTNKNFQNNCAESVNNNNIHNDK